MERINTSSAGSLKISGNTIIKIAASAASEVNGVLLTAEGCIAVPKSVIPFADGFIQPVKVKLSAESAVIEISIIIMQGYKAHSVAEEVQETVKNAVQSMTGIAVSKVNIVIAGIEPAAK